MTVHREVLEAQSKSLVSCHQDTKAQRLHKERN